jgi:hypothetical protein
VSEPGTFCTTSAPTASPSFAIHPYLVSRFMVFKNHDVGSGTGWVTGRQKWPTRKEFCKQSSCYEESDFRCEWLEASQKALKSLNVVLRTKKNGFVKEYGMFVENVNSSGLNFLFPLFKSVIYNHT